MTEASLVRRVTELESEVAGEKVVTRHILEQVRANTEILLELKKAIIGVQGYVHGEIVGVKDYVHGEIIGLKGAFLGMKDEMMGELLGLKREVIGLHQKVDRLSDRVAITEAKVTALETKLPGIVADVVRETIKRA